MEPASLRIAIGCDHAGYALKETLVPALEADGHALLDLGTFSPDPVDYPDFARAVGQAVLRGFVDVGILVCGSGVGASIAANKLPGIRAALCHDLFTARQSREDDDANLLCLGARNTDTAVALEVARAWLAARFSGEERHARRLSKIAQLERERGGRPGAPAAGARIPASPGGPPGAATPVVAATPATTRGAGVEARAATAAAPRAPEPAEAPEPQPGAGAASAGEPRSPGAGGRAVAGTPPAGATAAGGPVAAERDPLTLGVVEETLASLDAAEFADRLWMKDATLWPGDAGAIRNRLGWLTAATIMREHGDDLRAFADEIRRLQFRQVVLLGMGGSSLCAETLGAIFGSKMGFPDLLVLDSTDPAAVKQTLDRLSLHRALFLVATKSGATAETLALYAFFRRQVEAAGAPKPGMQFVAITDPGSPLEKLAASAGFRRTFLNPATIGGRYSALSFFGLVPAALIGVDTKGLLERAHAMVEACGAEVSVRDNPGIRLGAALGGLARAGRDKVTFAFSPEVGALGPWLEQLLAESLGKDGKGIVPVDGEPLGAPDAYGADRVFVALLLEGDAGHDAALARLAQAGHPVIRLALRDPLDLGAEFFRWELATAAAGAALAVNPFDEPDVARAKENTSALLAAWRKTRRLPEWPVDCEDGGVALMTGSGQRPASLAEGIGAHLGLARPGDYLAIQAYLTPEATTWKLLQELRVLLRDRLRIATTVAYGPRYLHSTGQLHKGGASTGLFVQITAEDQEEVAIPGADYGFGTLKAAQALGDLGALRDAGRRVVRLHLRDKPAAALARLVDVARSAVRKP